MKSLPLSLTMGLECVKVGNIMKKNNIWNSRRSAANGAPQHNKLTVLDQPCIVLDHDKQSNPPPYGYKLMGQYLESQRYLLFVLLGMSYVVRKWSFRRGMEMLSFVLGLTEGATLLLSTPHSRAGLETRYRTRHHPQMIGLLFLLRAGQPIVSGIYH